MATTSTTPLPLNCTVCPKKPFFSDSSHLLTHVGSKGHLSHYYKLKLKANHDLDAQEAIEIYDQWYCDHNVEQLMSERMTSKDRKRPRRRESAPTSKKQATSKPRRRQTFDVSPVKEEDPLGQTSFPNLPNPFAFAPVRQRPNRPQLYLWDTKRPGSYNATPVLSSSPLRVLCPRPAPMVPMIQRVPADQSDAEEELTEATRLKGVFWPGMDLFDSATPNTRRKRNQKKETSVAVTLERNALLVEPNEVIYTPLGTMRKSRFISGQIEYDSSPYKLDIPTPQPKRRQPKKVLAVRDENVPVGQSRQGSVPSFRGLSEVASSAKSSHAPAPPTKKRKRDFQVFDDRHEGELPSTRGAPEHAVRSPEGHPFGNANNMHLLNSAFHPSPDFDADGSRTGPAMMSLSNGQPCNTYFAEAFGHYQPAFYGMPYYGYGYYPPPGYNMGGFMPLPPQPQAQVKSEILRPEPPVTPIRQTVEARLADGDNINSQTLPPSSQPLPNHDVPVADAESQDLADDFHDDGKTISAGTSEAH